ncbi:hypothetical protein [Janthinobacterium fluminis]|uniref:Uncharacterized protein n=1 Tax=Janthinobacterium fluminis TaxID=2987524 RepID=A0ABT5JWM2_9BURK|nr:hypothetical protein [Janthinobacterium fluminis]MDC8756553.1 hypothetical protein [Janthinobacterium fluminis]
MNAKTQQGPKAVDGKLRERLLLARAVDGDRLMLADATMLAALDGSRALTMNERRALAQSPLTLRRFRHLTLERRRGAAAAANEVAWHGSGGMLRAAADGAALEQLGTDDGCWSLHFLAQADGWQIILKLAAVAPFAARLMRERPLLRVVDGGGAVILQGRLDGDGECECRWAFDTAPASHFHMYGAVFAVELAPA